MTFGFRRERSCRRLPHSGDQRGSSRLAAVLPISPETSGYIRLCLFPPLLRPGHEPDGRHTATQPSLSAILPQPFKLPKTALVIIDNQARNGPRRSIAEPDRAFFWIIAKIVINRTIPAFFDEYQNRDKWTTHHTPLFCCARALIPAGACPRATPRLSGTP